MVSLVRLASEKIAQTVDAPPIIRLSGVSKAFATRTERTCAVDELDLEIGRGRIVSLVGPSGSGKTTILNLIAGLARPDVGGVFYSGAPVTKPNTKIGYLTQSDALLPWRSVLSNVALPLEIRRTPKAQRTAAATEIIRRVGLAGFERHLPAQLSGGMRKRVAIARTLIYRPETLLLDEPFSALDGQTRRVVYQLLLELAKELGLTVALVTHDLDEAIALSDEIIVFSNRPARIVDHIFDLRDIDRERTHSTSRRDRLHERLSARLAKEVDFAEKI
jgi:NitT/TauT family transport system ATP-binding protein